MSKQKINHVWFDMDGTLTVHTDEFEKVHNDLCYQTYSSVVGREISLFGGLMDVLVRYDQDE